MKRKKNPPTCPRPKVGTIRCGKPVKKNGTYCDECKATYMREWRVVRSEELKRLRALEKSIKQV